MELADDGDSSSLLKGWMVSPLVPFLCYSTRLAIWRGVADKTRAKKQNHGTQQEPKTTLARV
jgi:hypothetical protein